ncbi:hypothetical protein KKC47_01440, partial [Patescibacteria group bacterium]|nr:hypothetical protein [Patescibacteria group bacterium]
MNTVRVWDWFWARTERHPVMTERCVGHEPVEPGLGPYKTRLQPVQQITTEWKTVPIEGWPMRRRLRFGCNVGLASTIIMAVFWGVWWLIAGSVPATTAISWTPEVSINLPFALSRLWDIPAVFGWAFGLTILGSFWPELWRGRNEDLGAGLGVGLVAGLVAGLGTGLVAGLAAGLAAGLVAGLAYGLVAGLGYGLVAGLAYGLVAGLGYGLGAGLGYGLGAGLGAGLAPLLPVALILIPLLV